MDYTELQSFYDGYSLHSYNIFGAHFTEGGVCFRVFAPNAASVRLVGDFNGWNNQATFLQKINSEIWEVTIPNLEEYSQYKYVIEDRKGKLVEKADPYAFYGEMRPGFSCKVASLEGYPWHDYDWMCQRDNNLNRPLNIYEVHLGGFKHHGAGRWFSYEEMVTELIPYVKDMGYTHIELMPLNEYPFDGSWGYQQYGYFSITARYGNPKQLMYFIDQCHQNGIGVIMDVVLCHFVKDTFGLVKFDGTCLYESPDSKKAQSQWDTYYFNFESNIVNSFLISSAALWLDKYHCDGLRVDAVSNLIYWHGDSSQGENTAAISFIKRFNYYLHTNYPGIMIIAEDSTAYGKVTKPTEYGGLGFDYKWDLGWMNDTIKYYNMDPEYRHYNHTLINFSMAYFYSENFILPLSHDEVVHAKGSVVNKMWGDYEQRFAQARNLMVYMFTHPGKKLNFMGNEFASFREFDENRELDWSLLQYPTHDSFKRLCRDLNNIYRSEEGLWNGEYSYDTFKWIDADNAEQRIFSYIRYGKEYCYVVVLNMSPVSYENFELGVPTYGYYTEIMNSEKDIYSGCNMCNFTRRVARKPGRHNLPYYINIRIAPYGGIIFKAKLR